MYPHERTLVDQMSGRPFVLLGVNTDKNKDKIRKAVRDNGLNWRSWLDGKRGGPICKKFKIQSYTTVMLIDHEGVIRFHSGSRKEMLRQLDASIEHLVSVAESADTGMREFVDDSGLHKVMAKYDKFSKGQVYLVDQKNEKIKIPWDKLSVDDQNYVATMRLSQDRYSQFVNANEQFRFDELKTFKDKSGQFSLKATYIGLDRTLAVFWDRNGKEVKIGYTKLSDESRQYISKENKRRKGTP